MSEWQSRVPCLRCGTEFEASEGVCPSCGTNLMLGDAYRIDGFLGAGGMSTVYSARRSSDGGRLAIKVLTLESALADWKSVELFERGMHVLEHLDHRGVVDFEATWHDDEGRLYLAQEIFEGGSLEDRIRDWSARLDREQVTDLLASLLEILDYLHTRVPPVLHRDVKPANIMFRSRQDWQPVLMDFDTVAAASQSSSGLTIVGTPGYVAPEQTMGDPQPASDLYAVGATMLYVISHVEPDALPRERGRFAVDEHLARLDEKTAEVIRKLVAPTLDERYATAREALDELLAEPPPVEPPAPVVTTPPVHRTAPPVVQQPPVHRPPVHVQHAHASQGSKLGCVITLLVFALFGGIGVATWFFVSEATQQAQQRQEAAMAQADEIQQEMQAQMEQQIGSQLSRGGLSPGQVEVMLQRGDLPPEAAAALRSQAAGGGGQGVLRSAVDCLQAVEERTRMSRARYLGWVDPEKGPTCKESLVGWGLYETHEYGTEQCKKAAAAARSPAAGDASSLAGPLATIAKHNASLQPLTAKASHYYDVEKYVVDECAQGQEMHPDLMEGFEVVLGAVDVLRAALEERVATNNAAAMERLRAERGAEMPYVQYQEALLALDALAGLFLLHEDEELLDEKRTELIAAVGAAADALAPLTDAEKPVEDLHDSDWREVRELADELAVLRHKLENDEKRIQLNWPANDVDNALRDAKGGGLDPALILLNFD